MEQDKRHNDSGVSVGPVGETGVFAGAPRLAYAYRKSEKIVTALYMVTGFMSDREPLKWKMRSLAGDVLSLTNDIKDKFSVQRDEVVRGIRAKALEVASCLEIARHAGLMSEMNAGVLREELVRFIDLFSEKEAIDTEANPLSFDPSFFSGLGDARPSDSHQDRRPYQGGKTTSFKRHIAPRPIKDRNEPAESGSVVEKKDRRRKLILDLVGKKGSVTIKDVSVAFRDVSEKTIQRELLAMVEEGALKKEGERRWSRYSLAAV